VLHLKHLPGQIFVLTLQNPPTPASSVAANIQANHALAGQPLAAALLYHVVKDCLWNASPFALRL
jgi:hypothetical protein